MLGAISDKTRSTLGAPTAARTCSRTSGSRKSPCTKSTPGMASMGSISVATMRLAPPTMRAAYWLQPPGAAPRSTQRMLGALDLLQLEHRARAPALALRAFDELIVRVLGQPAGAALGSLRHNP